MQTFVDSSSCRNDPDALRSRLRDDGYLFLRRLLDPAVVLGLRADFARVLAAHGWLEPGSDPVDARAAAEPVRHGDPAWQATFEELQRLESFHRFGHEASLLAVIGAVLGDTVVVHPRKTLRLVHPGLPAVTTPAHQDFTFIGSTVDLITAWIPLGACGQADGGLCVLRSSPRLGVLPVVPLAAGVPGRVQSQVDAGDPEWATADYEPGDVLLYHGLAVNRASPNTSERLLLTVDYRYQAVSDPVNESRLLPHNPREDGRRLAWAPYTEGWSTTRWVEVPPETVTESAERPARPIEALARSRLVDTRALSEQVGRGEVAVGAGRVVGQVVERIDAPRATR